MKRRMAYLEEEINMQMERVNNEENEELLEIIYLFYDGFNLLGNFSQFGGLDYFIKYVGIAFHYDSIKKGVIDSGDIIYFVSLNMLFLFASLTVIKTLKK